MRRMSCLGYQAVAVYPFLHRRPKGGTGTFVGKKRGRGHSRENDLESEKGGEKRRFRR